MIKKLAIVLVALMISACGGGGGTGGSSIAGPSTIVLIGDETGDALLQIDLRNGSVRRTTFPAELAAGSIIPTSDPAAFFIGSVLSGQIGLINVDDGSATTISTDSIGSFGGMAVLPSAEAYWFGTKVDSSVFPPVSHGTETYYSPLSGPEQPVVTVKTFCAAATTHAGNVLYAVEPNSANGSVALVEAEPVDHSLRQVHSSLYIEANYACFRDLAISQSDDNLIYAAAVSAKKIYRINRANDIAVGEVINLADMPADQRIRYIALEVGERTALVTTSAGLYRVELDTGRSALLFTAAQLNASSLSDVRILQ